ncbi:thioredoxin family protein [Natranaerofaba carboxydovora]|uniref:thioredoxin family protein n=1 Tax=Natranaerofaba carboxydovora TaxID=2742683 RepID=UPI001F13092C|nr:thioredoxin family protein [Natranaerofaba carboxydovora]UMZ73167.1 Thioredoxin domain protein [Natranaerofaba carboxydovora]
MDVKIMGPGCANCEKLFELVKEVASEKGLEANIEKVTDMNQITTAGVMMTPGLVIDGEVKSQGKIPSKEEISNIIDS